MAYRIDKKGLLDTLSLWNGFLSKKVHLIACGGTALTLLDIKPSTKDIDLVVPEETEYDYLINILKDLGYKQVTGSGWAKDQGFVFELFRGKYVHTTELLDSPLLKDGNISIKEFSYVYLGALNHYDLIISKLFRGTGVDIEDCLSLIKVKKTEIDMEYLTQRFHETASYDISEDKVNKNLSLFIKLVNKEVGK